MNKAAVLVLALSCLAAPAYADIAPPAPEDLDCQRGAVPFVPHVDPDARDERGRPLQAWPYCTPSTCEADTDCSDGRVCSDDVIGFCVQESVEGGETRRTIRPRGCEPDDTCLNVESTCERSRRCVAAAERAPRSDDEPDSNEPETPVEDPAVEPEAEAQDTQTSTETPAASTSGGCGCRVGGAPASRAGVIGLALLGLAATIRAGAGSRLRRRRSTRHRR
ncbi:MAG: hypothetical protein AB7S26_35770 [Sandaracinaceae bacterium]